MLTKIYSLRHPFVQELVELRLEKTARNAAGSLLLVGEKMIRELSSKVDFKALITTDPKPHINAQKQILVTPEILKKITGVPSPDGYAAVAPLPQPSSLSGCQRLLILDGLSDPGNLGTLLRTALALDWDGVLLTPGTVDPFNDKALRASKGALFSLPFSYEESSLPEQIYLADLEGESLSEMRIKPPFALILSNEGAGPSSTWRTKASKKICIPMHNGVDSLNVASSGAIFLYNLRSL